MKPGTKLKCIDDSLKPEQIKWQKIICPNWIKKNAIYTVKTINNHDDIVEGILLEEIQNPISFNIFLNKDIEPHFATWRFAEELSPEPQEEINEFTNTLIYLN